MEMIRYGKYIKIQHEKRIYDEKNARFIHYFKIHFSNIESIYRAIFVVEWTSGLGSSTDDQVLKYTKYPKHLPSTSTGQVLFFFLKVLKYIKYFHIKYKYKYKYSY